MDTEAWKRALQEVARPEKVAILSGFFKTGKGEYGEGDVFIGVSVPDNRKVARIFAAADYVVVEEMLNSDVHEYRLSALLSLVARYEKARTGEEKGQIRDFYLNHTKHINNWDLVDLSAEYIVGAECLRTNDYSVLFRLAESGNLWEQRIAVVSNLIPVRAGKFDAAVRLVEYLLQHPHDLMRKANGWILREIGKKDEAVLFAFLDKYASAMPRTTLRYAIERLPQPLRKKYMAR